MIKSLFISLCLFACGSLYAQDPAYLHLDRNKGIPSSSVYDVLEDDRGKIWFATEIGIISYDGVHFNAYNQDSLTTGACSAMLKDSSGTIWFENFDGYIFYLKNDTLHPLTHRSAPTGFAPFGLLGNKLIVPSRNGFEVYNCSDGSYSQLINYSYEVLISTAQSDSSIYVLTNREMIEIKADFTIRPMGYKPEVSRRMVLTHASDRGVDILYKYNDLKRITNLKSGFKPTHLAFPVSTFVQGLSKAIGHLWISTNRGAWRTNHGVMEGPFWEQFSISKVYEDSRGLVWVSTLNDGVLVVQDTGHLYFDVSPYTLSTVCEVPDGYLFGTKDGNLILSDHSLQSFNIYAYTGLQKPIQTLYYDELSKKLLVVGNGLQLYDYESKKLQNRVDVGLKAIKRLNEKEYAYASSGAIGIVDSRSLNSEHPNFRPLISQIRSRSVDYSGDTLFFAGNTGLISCIHEDCKTLKSQPNSVPFKGVWVANGQVWALSNGGKMYRVWSDSLVLEKRWQLNETIVFMATTYNNELYFLTPSGILSVGESQNEYEPLPLIKVYLPSDEVQFFRVEEQRILLITEQGVTSINKNSTSNSDKVPVFLLKDILAAGAVYNARQPLKLGYDNNNVEITYTILSYGQTVEPSLFYQLNKKNWTKATKGSRSIRLPALAPDHYQILFAFDTTNLSLASMVEFTIEKPFWQRLDFQATLVILLATLMIVFFQLRVNRLKEKMALEKELSHSTLTALRSQMNPHFFFNALNTIQAYIFQNDKHQAANYLAKFSKLTRMILEQSAVEKHPLSEEITALTLYLELEKMRFNEDFNFSITVENSITPELILVPAMLIQPYVENAVKHGLLHAKGEKIIEIVFKTQDQNLIVVINDNGIGRKKAMELRQQRAPEHRSFATQATDRRLSVLNAGRKNPLTVDITDKIDDQDRPVGTLVKITLPLPLFPYA